MAKLLLLVVMYSFVVTVIGRRIRPGIIHSKHFLENSNKWLSAYKRDNQLPTRKMGLIDLLLSGTEDNMSNNYIPEQPEAQSTDEKYPEVEEQITKKMRMAHRDSLWSTMELPGNTKVKRDFCHFQTLKVCGKPVLEVFEDEMSSLTARCYEKERFLDCIEKEKSESCREPKELPMDYSPKYLQGLQKLLMKHLYKTAGCVLRARSMIPA